STSTWKGAPLTDWSGLVTYTPACSPGSKPKAPKVNWVPALSQLLGRITTLGEGGMPAHASGGVVGGGTGVLVARGGVAVGGTAEVGVAAGVGGGADGGCFCWYRNTPSSDSSTSLGVPANSGCRSNTARSKYWVVYTLPSVSLVSDLESEIG